MIMFFNGFAMWYLRKLSKVPVNEYLACKRRIVIQYKIQGVGATLKVTRRNDAHTACD